VKKKRCKLHERDLEINTSGPKNNKQKREKFPVKKESLTEG